MPKFVSQLISGTNRNRYDSEETEEYQAVSMMIFPKLDGVAISSFKLNDENVDAFQALKGSLHSISG